MKFVIQNVGETTLVVQYKKAAEGIDPQGLIEEVKVKKGVYQTIETEGALLVKDFGVEGLVKAEDVFFGD
jgi:outer membrane usher protein FimD/PapC